MVEENTKAKTLQDLMQDPKYANLADDAEIPAELLEKLDGEELTSLFVEQMISDKGLEPTDELRQELADKVTMRVSREIVSNLPDYMVDRVNKGMAAGNLSDDEINKIIEEAGIDVDTITTNAMMEFRDEYLNGKENA